MCQTPGNDMWQQKFSVCTSYAYITASWFICIIVHCIQAAHLELNLYAIWTACFSYMTFNLKWHNHYEDKVHAVGLHLWMFSTLFRRSVPFLYQPFRFFFFLTTNHMNVNWLKLMLSLFIMWVHLMFCWIILKVKVCCCALIQISDWSTMEVLTSWNGFQRFICFGF